MFFHMYIVPGQGQTSLCGQNSDVYIVPGQGQTSLCGQNSDVNRKALSLCPFVASFKKISLKSNFIHIFACFYTCI